MPSIDDPQMAPGICCCPTACAPGSSAAAAHWLWQTADGCARKICMRQKHSSASLHCLAAVTPESVASITTRQLSCGRHKTYLAMLAVMRLPTVRICSTSLRMLKSSSPSCGLSLSASLTCGSMMMCGEMQHHKYEYAAFAVPQTLRSPHQNDDLLGRTAHPLLGLVCLAGIWNLEADCMIALCHNRSKKNLYVSMTDLRKCSQARQRNVHRSTPWRC